MRQGVASSAVAVGLSGGGAAGVGSPYHQLRFGRDVYPYVVYIPPGRRAHPAMPLVVVLHGCTMTATEQAAASGYDQIARARGFAVLYPDVDAADRANDSCWKAIWNPGSEIRGRGDTGAIAAMTRAVVARWRIDPSRVYAIGISAGGFETSRLGAAYPDLYTAIGIHSGGGYLAGEYGCPTSGPAGNRDAAAQAAFGAMGSHARVMPVIVFHGDSDGTIPYRCGQQALAQWLTTDDLVLQRERRASVPSTGSDSSRRRVGAKRSYAVVSYAKRSECPIAEFWTIHGMGHDWSGGSADPSSLRYSDPRGPSASDASWAFFSTWRRSALGARCTHPDDHQPLR